jgi:U1 small nuclear ribonucleoprotein
VAHLSYATTEERLRKEFETFGKIDHVRIVKNLEGKSRGYGFITFRHEKDAIYARDKGDGRRVDNHRILVDKELGRTKNSWLPRRDWAAAKVVSLVKELPTTWLKKYVVR